MFQNDMMLHGLDDRYITTIIPFTRQTSLQSNHNYQCQKRKLRDNVSCRIIDFAYHIMAKVAIYNGFKTHH